MSGEDEAVRAVREARDAETPYPADRFDGQGIVICAGGARILTCAWVTVSLLRRELGCTMPIEIWHLGEQELGPTEAALFAELGAATVDAEELRSRYPARVLGAWELKPYALAHSRFREVLLLDADNVPVCDPAFLFDSAELRETGALFWPDVVQLGAENPVWAMCELDHRSEPAWESGQVLVDKSRCWHALMLALRMNEHSDVFYRHLLGDKDTYHLAWRMLDQPCALPRRPLVMPYGLLQHDFASQPLFQHRSHAKWVLRGENLLDPSFRHEDACLRYLTELEARWSGRIEPLPARSPADLAAEAQLAASRLFRLERQGSDETALELLGGNRVGDGRGEAIMRWYVLDGALVFEGLRGVSVRLTRRADGSWEGESELPGSHRVALRPLDQVASPAAAVVAAMLDALARGALEQDETVTALVTIGRVLDISEPLAVERARAGDGGVVADAVDRARWRLGRRDPSLRPLEASHRRHYEPS